MKAVFYKYQGTGNDFIVLDNRAEIYQNLDIEGVKSLCNRRFGIGADGLMLLQNHKGFNFEMKYFNADGKPGSMCGNGGRCIVAFARFLGIIKNETNFLAVDGPHYARIAEDDGSVSLKMSDVNDISSNGEDLILDTGSPHYIRVVKSLEHIDVFSEGSAIRNNETYKEKGINVNFVELTEKGLSVRTFERGVEDETFACGTGVTAAAIAMAKKENAAGMVEKNIKVLGGDLKVSFEMEASRFTNIYLTGPAEMVFSGEINLQLNVPPGRS